MYIIWANFREERKSWKIKNIRIKFFELSILKYENESEKQARGSTL